MNLNKIFMDIYIWIFMAFGFGELWIFLDTSSTKWMAQHNSTQNITVLYTFCGSIAVPFFDRTPLNNAKLFIMTCVLRLRSSACPLSPETHL